MSEDESHPVEPLVEPLTRREREVLAYLNEGFSAPEIAEQLFLAVSSVKWHIQQLYGKLGVNSKRQALNRARELGLLEVPAAGTAGSPAAPTPEAPAVLPPIGTVTFLFTDIEGSTRLLEQLKEQYATILADQRDLLRAAFEAHGGHEIDTQGDAFFVAFPRALDAIRCVIAAQQALAAHAWPQGVSVRVRMGLHTGEPILARTGYVGMDVHRAARIAAAGHGGQVLLSQTTRDLIQQDLPSGVALRPLGEYKLQNIAFPQPIYQLDMHGLPVEFPPLRTRAGDDEPPTPGEPPYKGLQYFDEADFSHFFGREALTERLVERVCAGRFLTVVGASGSGKSSLARAGLVSVLKRGGRLAAGQASYCPDVTWQVHLLTPTAHPLEALASSLTRGSESVTAASTLMDDMRVDARSLHFWAHRELQIAQRGSQGPAAARILLVVDQFEELFTLCRDEAERRAFVDNLLAAVEAEGGGISAVLTLRADFYEHLAAYANLSARVARDQEYIGAMNAAELRQAIEAPAAQGGWDLSPGLVDLLLHDVGAAEGQQPEPGALPLLSHALLETWKRRRGRSLTLHGYGEAGGVRGAIAKTAESVFGRFNAEQQAIARNIFLRLTELGEGTQDTRRRATRAELVPRPQEAEAVDHILRILSEARLVTAGHEVFEVAHEALIREWPTLRGWLAENREGLRLHRHLTEASVEWLQRQRDPSELYRGTRLAQALEWAQYSRQAGDLNELEREFLAASQAATEDEAAEREARRQRELVAAQQIAEIAQRAAENAQALTATELRRSHEQARANRLLRRLAVGLALLLLLAVVASGLAIQQARLAQRDAHLARANEWAAEAGNQLAIDPERSIWLAMFAIDEAAAAGEAYLPHAEEALHRAIQATRILLTLPHDNPVIQVRFSADGRRVVTVDDRTVVRVWDIATPGSGARSLFQFALTKQAADAPVPFNHILELSADGTRVARGDSDTVTIWDVVTGQLQQTLVGRTGVAVHSIAFNQDGSRLAVSSETGAIIIWNTLTGERLRSLPSGAARQMAFSPDGTRLAVVSEALRVSAATLMDTETGQVVMSLYGHNGPLVGITYSPDGRYLVTDGVDSTARVWDAASGEQLAVNDAGQVGVLSFSPDGQQVAEGNGVWKTGTNRLLYDLRGHTSYITSLAYSPDGTRLATASGDRTVKIWDATPTHEWLTWSVLPTFVDNTVFDIEFSPTNKPGEVLLAAAATSAADISVRREFPELLWEKIAVWNVLQGQPVWQVPPSQIPLDLSFSSDGAQLAVSESYQISGWETETGQRKFLSPLPSNDRVGLTGVTFYPDGKRVAFIDCGGHIWTWEIGARELAFAIETFDPADDCGAGLPKVRVSPDGRLLAAVGLDHLVRLIDANTGQALNSLSGHQDRLYGLAFSADGRLLAAGSEDTTITVWDVSTGALLFSLAGHSQGITGLAFSPDGTMLASSARDGAVKLWDLDRRQEKLTLFRDAGPIQAVAFSSDGKYLAAAGGDVQIFLPRLEDLLALARARLTRSLTIEECHQYLRLDQCPVLP